jgi:FkbM family methyltransferase
MMLNALKQRVAMRLRPFVEQIVTTRLAEAERRFMEALQRSRQAEPPPFASARTIELPADMRLLHIPGIGNPGFDLVVRSDPGPYDRTMIDQRPYSDIAMLLNMELGGTGTLVDLGANIGTISLPVAAAGSSVIAVELLPGNCLRLTLAALVNGLTRMRTVQAAVSARDGLLSFSGDEAWGTVGGSTGQQAVALRLDTILADAARENPALLRPPFALKIDVEGHEHEALLGADRFLGEWRPLVVFECIQLGEGIEKSRLSKQLLVDRGYALFMLRERLLVPKCPTDVQEELVGDFVAVPQERVATMLDRFQGYEIRQPSTEERLRWLNVLIGETDEHCRHAARVIERLSGDDAGFAEASAPLNRIITERLG